jgi:hypothetical protein
MATNSRQTAIFGLQDWKRFYQTYNQADFQSYDYETLRKNFVDYLTTYYPETFNDYIESSEFVALLDVMAFMGQALAFRNDLNTRENFIDTAERRDSVIKLANLVSYTPKRNITAQGLLKITAISTTESVIDINGNNLSNLIVLWNDSANINWQEQFNSVLNAALINSQRVGRPGNTNTILDVKTDVYSINTITDTLPVIPFRAEINGVVQSFELVSVSTINSDTIYELPPAPTDQFNIIYQNDKLGFGSVNTGFYAYFKQGTLQSVDFSFAEPIQNNFQEINVQGINDSDTWLYQLDSSGSIQTSWTKSDNLYTTPNLQSNSSKNIFSVSSRFNDQVTYNFGDGVFSEIPIGPFRAYVRSGNAETYTISPSEMQGIVVTINYISRNNRAETLTLTLSLQTTVNTALQRETLTQIKERAPSRFYTQNRMVNGEDYTNFPFTLFNSVVKSKAVNRTSIGISRNLDLLDPTAKYSSTNIFADDGALYTDNTSYITTFSTLNINIAVEFLNLTLPVLLSQPSLLQYYYANYSRYSGYYPGAESIDNKVYWNSSTVDGNLVSGFFYVKQSSTVNLPISVGAYSNYNMKYISEGAQLKFVAPSGYYFDSTNRLKSGVPNVYAGDKTYIWVGVLSVIDDGKNFGTGNLTNGTGPIKLSSYVPGGAILASEITTPASTSIIPSFDNTLDLDIKNSILTYIKLEQDFSLLYDNSLLATQNRWSVSSYDDTNWIVNFKFNSIDKTYLVTIRNLNYYFGSVDQVRFAFEEYKKIYDPKSGQTLSDFINIFKTNSNSTNTGILGQDYVLYVIDRLLSSDGYADDYQVKITSINANTGFSFDPDFFVNIVGTSTTAYVFFENYIDSDSLARSQILPPDEVIYAYATENSIKSVIYEYPANTVFYATAENKFFKSSIVLGTTPTVLQLVDVTSSYSVLYGKNSINFQYRHNSSNTTRIDPSTSNIIDLYVVTQAYYSEYQNWINDSTGTISEPERPSINELQQSYGSLDDYKMISDSVILNSVVFKPLFGTKAESKFRGKIKVIKNSTVAVSDSQIRSSVLSALNSYFTIDKWDFGDTFYFSELTAYLHVELGGLISSVVLVSDDPTQSFGDLYEIRSAPNEIFVNGATINDIVVISALTPQALQRA